MSAKTTDTDTMGKDAMLILQRLIYSASLGKCKEFPIIKVYSVHRTTDEINGGICNVHSSYQGTDSGKIKTNNNSTIQLHMGQQIPYGNYIII